MKFIKTDFEDCYIIEIEKKKNVSFNSFREIIRMVLVRKIF